MADISQAKTFAVIDEFGVDPLRDKSFDAITSIKSFTYHTVKPEEQYNMPLISYKAYLNEEHWRVLMIYNGIADMFALKEGMRIKVPALTLVASALNRILTEQAPANTTVRI